MEDLNNNNDFLIKIFSQIFYNFPNNENTFHIKNASSIDQITQLLTNENISKQNLAIIFKTLIKAFQYNRGNILIFYEKIPNFLEILIKIFFCCFEDANNEILALIDEIANSVNLNKKIVDFFFQNFAQFFHQEKFLISKRVFMSRLELLKRLFGLNFSAKKPYNYFYLNGEEKGITIRLLPQRKISVSFSLKYNFDFEKKDYLISNKIISNKVELITLKSNTTNLFEVITINYDNLVVFHKGNNIFSVDKKSFPLLPGKYNTITLSCYITKIKNSSSTNINFSLYINERQLLHDFNIIVMENNETEIDSISVCNNLFGEIGSIMITSPMIDYKYHNDIHQNYPQGFAIPFQIKQFLVSNLNYVDCVKCLCTPYAEDANALDSEDKFTINLGDFRCHLYNALQKKIALIGGINVILPIVELIYLNEEIYEEILPSYFEVIFVILTFKLKNMNDAIGKHFFQMLSVFIEKMNKKYFTPELMKIMIDIAKNIFAFLNRCDLFKIYLDYILLNERIYSNFEYNVQIELWEQLKTFQVSDEDGFNKLISIKQLTKILLNNEKTYNFEKKICCEDHLNAVDEFNREREVMVPSLNERDGHIVEIIKSLINKKDERSINDIYLLSEYLTLDLSPCLIRNIIDIILIYFDNNSSIDNNFIESSKLNVITLSLLSNDFLDIKYKTLKLISSILNLAPSLVNNFPFTYVKLNLLPKKTSSNTLLYPTEDDIRCLASHCYNKINLINELSCSEDHLIFYSIYDPNYVNTSITKMFEIFIDWVKNPIFSPKMKNIFDIMIYMCKNSGIEHTTTLITNLHLVCYTNPTIAMNIANYKPLLEYVIDVIIRYRYHQNSIHKTTLRFLCDLLLKMSFNSRIDIVTYLTGTMSQIKFGPKNNKENKKMNDAINDLIRTVFIKLLSIKTTEEQGDKLFAEIIFKAFDYLTMFNRDKCYVIKLLNNIDNIFIQSDTLTIANLFLQGLNVDKQKFNYSSAGEIWNDYQLAVMIINIFDEKINKVFNHFTTNKKDNKIYPSNIDYIFQSIVLGKSEYFYRFEENLTFLLISEVHTVPMIKLISFLYMILLTLSKNSEELLLLTKKYQNFIIFNIILSIFIDTSSKEKIKNEIIQEHLLLLLDQISFGICFFFDIYNDSNGKNKEEVSKLLNEVLYLLYLISLYKTKGKNGFLKSIFKGKHISITAAFKFSTVFPFEINFEADSSTDFIKEIVSNEKMKNTFSGNNPYIINRYIPYVQIEVFLQNALARLDFTDENEFEIVSTDVVQKYSNEEIEAFYKTQKKNIKKLIEVDFIKQKKFVFSEIKYNRNLYKKLKKKLFFFNGAWSDPDLFYNSFNKLKVKILNHLTKNFTKPFLTPLLDVDYYIPKFSHFNNVYDLFNDKNETKKNKIVLDITEILSSKNKSDDDLFVNNIDYIIEENEEISKIEKKYECCLVKASHHIKGIFLMTNNGIEFNVYPDQTTSNYENNDDFDKSRGTCFGSYFVSHHKDKDHLTYIIPYQNIKFAFKRKYYYRESGIEIYTYNNKNYYFNFKNVETRDILYILMNDYCKNKSDSLSFIVVNELTKKKSNKATNYGGKKIGFCTNNSTDFTLSSIVEKWQNNKLSNFEYIMYLNIFSNRSYSDISQYPIFPWFISDYETDSISKITYRDLSLPMGMMINDKKGVERKEIYISTYKGLVADSKRGNKGKYTIVNNENYTVPYFYGSHYSNPFYVSHFLTRIFPFTHIMLELQGDKFDDPNRLFLSLKNSFEGASTQKGDVREIIPEFLFLPEMFLNINNLDMGIKSNQSKVNDVGIPKWSDEDPYKCVYYFNEIFEGDNVTEHLNEWIDLVFGYKQKGEEAQKAHNIFMRSTYIELIDIDNIPKEDKDYYYRLGEFGITPKQIFLKASEKKINHIADNQSMISLWKNNDNIQQIIVELGGKERNIEGIKTFGDNELVITYSNGDGEYIVLNHSLENQGCYSYSTRKFLHGRGLYRKPSSNDKISLFNSIKLNCSDRSSPILIYNNGKIIAEAGYIDGKITISNIEEKSLPYSIYVPLDESPIITLAMTEDERLAIVGNTRGIIYTFKVNLEKWIFQYRIIHHSEQINHINISNQLNAFISCSKDNYVNVYILPGCKLIHSFRSQKPIYSFICANKLGAYIVYSLENKSWTSRSLNGHLLTEVKEAKPQSPQIFKDCLFRDCLIYKVNNFIYVRGLPYMEELVKISLQDDIYSFQIGLNYLKNKVFLIEESGKFIVVLKEKQIIDAKY